MLFCSKCKERQRSVGLHTCLGCRGDDGTCALVNCFKLKGKVGCFCTHHTEKCDKKGNSNVVTYGEYVTAERH